MHRYSSQGPNIAPHSVDAAQLLGSLATSLPVHLLALRMSSLIYFCPCHFFMPLLLDTIDPNVKLWSLNHGSGNPIPKFCFDQSLELQEYSNDRLFGHCSFQGLTGRHFCEPANQHPRPRPEPMNGPRQSELIEPQSVLC